MHQAVTTLKNALENFARDIDWRVMVEKLLLAQDTYNFQIR